MNLSMFTWEMYDGKFYNIAKVLKILKIDYYLHSSMFSKIEMYTSLFCSLDWAVSAFILYDRETSYVLRIFHFCFCVLFYFISVEVCSENQKVPYT